MQGVGTGQVVAGRYRLNTRRARIGEIDVWAATDDTLGREVQVTVLPTSLPNAGDIVDAARRSAAIVDHRIVRVLDVGSDIQMSWVVEESLSETRTLAQLTEMGTLPPEEARRIAGEVASALAVAARRGVHHLHLTPHSVRMTDTGLIKIAGLGMASAIEGTGDDISPREAEQQDVRGVVALMYAVMTARWPLATPVRGMAAAPRVGAGVAVPSELVVAVSPSLDAIVRSTLNQGAGPTNLVGLADQLHPWSTTRVTKVAHRSFAHRGGGSTAAVVGSAAAGTAAEPAPRTAPPVPAAPSVTQRLRKHRESRLAAERRDLEERRADPGYLNLREALAVGDGHDEHPAPVAPGLPAVPGRDGRFAKPILAVVAGSVLVATALALPVLMNTFADSTAATAPTDSSSAAVAASTPAASPTPTGASTAADGMEITDVTSFDPDGDGSENEGQASLAADGNTETAWRTERYNDPANVGGSKVGVGVVLQLAEASTVDGVRVDGAGGQSFTVYTNTSPDLEGATEVGSVEDAPSGESDIAAASAITDAEYVVILLTGLPEVDDGYRGAIAEVAVY